MDGGGSDRRLAEGAALAAALAPIVVVVGWALQTGWMPLGDSAQLMVRSRDVLTRHQPLLGAWSSSSQRLGHDVNNLGPLYVELMAPFTKLSPFGGAAVGVGLVNALCVVGVWWVARRQFGSLGAVAAMGATVALEASMGSQALLESRQQLALVLPFWCLLWLAVALWEGEPWALAPTALVASLLVQTHFTLVYPVVVVLVAVAVASLPGRWAGRAVGPALGWTALVVLLCWAQPLWDQLTGTGNLSSVIGRSGGEGGIDGPPGLAVGAELVGRTTLRWPFSLPGSMGRALDPPLVAGRVDVTTGTWATLVIWFVLLGLANRTARQAGRDRLAALAGVAAAAVVGGVVAASAIPTGAFSVYPPQNYYWMWPVGLLAFAAVAAVGIDAVVRLVVVDRVEPRLRVAPLWALAVATVAFAVPTSRPASSLDYVDREANHQQDVGRDLADQLGTALDAYELSAPVVIDFVGDQRFTGYRWLPMALLQARDVEFVFDAGTADLRRFGRSRCDDGAAPYRLLVESGDGVRPPPPGGVVLAAAVERPFGFPVAFVLVPETDEPDDACRE